MAITTDGAISKDPNSSTNQTITTPTISGGTIDNAVIGGTTAAAGTFTTVTAPQIYGSVADNGDIAIDGTSSSTKTTSNVVLQGSGGNVGIGVTPTAKLHVVEGSTFLKFASGQLDISDGTNAGLISSVAASGEKPAGIGLAGNNGKGAFVRPGTTAGDVAAMVYYNGTAYYSAAEVASVASNYGTLSLMKSGGTVTIGGGAVHRSQTTNTGGGLRVAIAEATANIEADASTTIAVNVPAGARILGCQLRVDTALTATELWDAAYAGGATQAIASAQAVAKNTKVNTMFNTNAATDITSDVTTIAITKNGGGSFTAAGTIRAVVYYEDFIALSDAP